MKNLGLLDADSEARAVTGPRELKSPTSREYAIQTVRHLTSLLRDLRYDENKVRVELGLIDQYRHWEVLGYPTREALLDAELGELSPLAKERLHEAQAAVALAREQDRETPAEGGRPSKTETTRINKSGLDVSDTKATVLRRLARRESAAREAGATPEQKAAGTKATELLQRVERGEITANRAALAAGIRKPPKHPPVYLANDMRKVAEVLKRRYTADELRQLIDILAGPVGMKDAS